MHLFTPSRVTPHRGCTAAVRDPATDLERAFAALAHECVDALCMLGDPAFTPYRTRIVELVAARRLPATYGSRGFVEAGGLMSYTQDSAAMARCAGVMVDKILRGTKPADIPAEFPMQFELTINLKTAKALGLTIPQDILALSWSARRPAVARRGKPTVSMCRKVAVLDAPGRVRSTPPGSERRACQQRGHSRTWESHEAPWGLAGSGRRERTPPSPAGWRDPVTSLGVKQRITPRSRRPRDN